MRGVRFVQVSLVLLPLLAVLAAAAPDWPQWRGEKRDGAATGFAAPETWPAELTRGWQVTVGDGDSTPALVGDRLYVFAWQGEEELLLCLNAADGTEIWREAYKTAQASGPGGRHAGPRSSPVVTDGKVFTLGVSGVVSCFDAESGKTLWRKDPFPGVVPRFFTSMSPLVAEGMCIAHVGGAGNGALIAYDAKTGEEAWRWGAEGPDYASPVLLTTGGVPQVVTLSEKSIVGVGLADGKLLWQLPFLPERRAYNCATPIVREDTVFVTGAQRGTRAIRIEKKDDGFAATEIWHAPQADTQFNTPVLKDGFLYGASPRGTLFCLNAETGAVAWADETPRGRGGFAAIVDVGPALLVLPPDGELVVLKPDPAACTELAKYKVSAAQTYAHPVVSGNRVFIKDLQTLTLWTLD